MEYFNHSLINDMVKSHQGNSEMIIDEYNSLTGVTVDPKIIINSHYAWRRDSPLCDNKIMNLSNSVDNFIEKYDKFCSEQDISDLLIATAKLEELCLKIKAANNF